MRGATQKLGSYARRSGISIHAPHAGCDRSRRLKHDPPFHFNPRTPCGVRRGSQDRHRHAGHFNPRTPCGVRHGKDVSEIKYDEFQSTHPMRGATWSFHRQSSSCAFQSTHPMRGATVQAHRRLLARGISIHAPHAGCDDRLRAFVLAPDGISIHAPHAGCDLRGQLVGGRGIHFNPRTPCGVRPIATSAIKTNRTFQSTHPMRGATDRMARDGRSRCISIHAPHAGCDRRVCGL